MSWFRKCQFLCVDKNIILTCAALRIWLNSMLSATRTANSGALFPMVATTIVLPSQGISSISSNSLRKKWLPIKISRLILRTSLKTRRQLSICHVRRLAFAIRDTLTLPNRRPATPVDATIFNLAYFLVTLTILVVQNYRRSEQWSISCGSKHRNGPTLPLTIANSPFVSFHSDIFKLEYPAWISFKSFNSHF